ncbi:MAG TPA: hypothetical protein VJP80_03715 [Candidatus Saccharimonadales bacterium]|nr:hypothetical protein [Candidatus Saccharimonadales bacterium]
MKFRLNVLLILAGSFTCGVLAATPNFYAGFHDLPRSVRVYHYKIPDRVLEAQVLAAMGRVIQEKGVEEARAKQHAEHGTVSVSTTFLVLPQLYLFDEKGQEILARTAESNDLDKLLDHAFSSSIPIRSGKLLSARLDILVPDGKFPAVKPGMTSKFTVLEYWAPWCEYCFVERDQLLAYFRKHSNLNVNWITADADVSKVGGVKMSPNTSS